MKSIVGAMIILCTLLQRSAKVRIAPPPTMSKIIETRSYCIHRYQQGHFERCGLIGVLFRISGKFAGYFKASTDEPLTLDVHVCVPMHYCDLLQGNHT
ncbi:hypothetical protein EDD21DRAFT_388431 [Dissophora ornata]|nr:hypothetical protein EDD21DRAFT_388431 [Dissophora ornata]